MRARERIAQLADTGSFNETDRWFSPADPLHFHDLKPYEERLRLARAKTGLRDAVVTGECRIGGYPAVLAVLDFEFMGGSMGSVVGEKVARAFERAYRRRVPVVTISTSGGARMQEGMLSLMQMAKTAAAAARLRQRGVPFISVLTDPTMGGIYASFASLGDVILAEPGARIAFAGPRVVEQTVGPSEDGDYGRAEELLRDGLVDCLVSPHALKPLLIRLLSCLADEVRFEVTAVRGEAHAPHPEERGWDILQRARRADRPTTLTYLQSIFTDFVPLSGDRMSGDDPALVAGFAKLDGRSVVLLGQERGPDDPRRRGGRMLPEGYRKALRAMKLAEKFSLPLVTLIDTPGSLAIPEAERRGLAGSLAACLAFMSEIRTPTVAAVIGEGGSGGALALALADRLLVQENGVFSVIGPEGAAAILYRDASRAEDLTESLKLTSHDLLRLGLIDDIVPEPPGGAHLAPEQAAAELRDALVRHIYELDQLPLRRLVRRRYRRYRAIGEYSSVFREMVLEEVGQGWRAARDLVRRRGQSEAGQSHLSGLGGSQDEGQKERNGEAADQNEAHPL
jgi:acetyl-CoA carboxylase carboxyl transferase subunit beta